MKKGRAINPAFLKIRYNESILFHVSEDILFLVESWKVAPPVGYSTGNAKTFFKKGATDESKHQKEEKCKKSLYADVWEAGTYRPDVSDYF